MNSELLPINDKIVDVSVNNNMDVQQELLVTLQRIEKVNMANYEIQITQLWVIAFILFYFLIRTIINMYRSIISIFF